MLSLSDIDLQNISPSKLGEILIEAKKAYYTGGKPIMDDHTYDTLEEILRQKSPHHRIFTKVGNPNFDTGFDKKRHLMPMGSQNKVTNLTDLVHYFELKKSAAGNVDMRSISYVVQPKCDGLSVELVYNNGELVKSITRGDGEVGDVITQNVVKMQGAVVSLSNHFSGSVRCEIVVTKNDFKKLPPEYSNPRNAASGISQRLDSLYSELCSLMAVDIFPNLDTVEHEIKFLKKLGFTPVESTICTDFHQIENIYQQFFTQKRLEYPYDIDGLVIKINDLSIAEKLGTKNGRPKYQVAYKFPSDSNQTILKSINWQVGPMGTITPVGEVEPIELSGAIISFASLGNYDLVKQKDLNIGDIVEISRRGDVIPHIEKVVTKVTPGHIQIPDRCPSCGTKLIIEDKFLRCPNITGCLPQIIGSLNLFCQTLDILGLSDKTITKLYQAGRVKLPGDFYRLTPEDIQDLDNLGAKSAKNIIHQIQSKKALSLVEVFDSAIIPNFSRARILQLISAGFNIPDSLLNLTVDQLIPLPGFQKTLAQKVVEGISQRRSWIESILSQVTLKKSASNQKFAGQNFVITGTLKRPRKEAIELIESLGGKVQTAVSQNTSYLLTNETNSQSSKFVTAQKLNIPIIDENRFNELLGNI